MREIKFRGKNTNTGKWVYGLMYHIKVTNSYYIGEYKEEVKVIPESIGQYTGLKDKDGNEIYENDILAPDNLGIGYIQYSNYACSFVLKCEDCIEEHICPTFIRNRNLVVIGNIYDNPEILNQI